MSSRCFLYSLIHPLQIIVLNVTSENFIDEILKFKNEENLVVIKRKKKNDLFFEPLCTN